jgi:hypothetical protein
MTKELQVCRPHLERTGARVPASRIVSQKPMCSDCFSGKPVRPLIEEVRGIRLGVFRREGAKRWRHFVRRAHRRLVSSPILGTKTRRRRVS